MHSNPSSWNASNPIHQLTPVGKERMIQINTSQHQVIIIHNPEPNRLCLARIVHKTNPIPFHLINQMFIEVQLVRNTPCTQTVKADGPDFQWDFKVASAVEDLTHSENANHDLNQKQNVIFTLIYTVITIMFIS
jgi:hypothetical protein